MKDLIYNQKKIPKNKWRYGIRSSAAAGCGWIATYNALRIMGYHADPESLIRYYVRQFPLINGSVGTFLFGPALFFKQRGFRVKISVRPGKFDEIVKNSDVCIMFYYWHRKLKFGSHFAAVHEKEGKYISYNTFSNSAGPDDCGVSLSAFLKGQKYFCPVLIAIRDKHQVI